MDSGNVYMNLGNGNQTSANYDYTKSATFLLIMIFAMFLPGFFGNILVLVIFGKGHIPLVKPVNILIRVLAVCDVMSLTNILTFTVVTFVDPGVVKGHGYLICTLYDVTATLPTLYSSFIAACMAIDRFLAICAPYFYETRVTIKKVIATLIFGAVAVMGIVAMKFTPLSFQTRADTEKGSCITFWTTKNPLENIYGNMYASFGLLCTFVIVVTNTGVLVEVIRMARRIGPQTVTSGRKPKVHIKKKEDYFEIIKPELQFAKTLLGVLFITVVCWIPMAARVLGAQTGLWRDDKATDQVILFCFGLPIVLDPYSYVILRRQYRKAAKRLILNLFKKCCYRRRPATTTELPNNEETSPEDSRST